MYRYVNRSELSHSFLLLNNYAFLFLILVPAEVEVEATVKDFLDMNEVTFFQFPLPPECITVALKVLGAGGRVVLYASGKVQNPSEALYDVKLDTSSSIDAFVDPLEVVYAMEYSHHNTNVSLFNSTVYVSLLRVGQRSEFVFSTVHGNVTLPALATATTSPPTTQSQTDDTTATNRTGVVMTSNESKTLV